MMVMEVLSEAAILRLSRFWPLSFYLVKSREQQLVLSSGEAFQDGRLALPTPSPPRVQCESWSISWDSVASISVASLSSPGT